MKKLALTFFAIMCLCMCCVAQKSVRYAEPMFDFEVTVDSANDACYVNEVRIYQKSTKKILQRITIPDNGFDCSSSSGPPVVFEDMNFDGMRDFRVMQFLPAAPNIPYYFYLYNKSKKTFERDTTLEEITSPDFHSDTKKITSFWRGSCCHHGSSTYQYIDGRITLIGQVEILSDVDKQEQVTIFYQRIGGELKEVKRTVEKMPPD